MNPLNESISARVAQRRARIREVALQLIRERGRVYSYEVYEVLERERLAEQLNVAFRVNHAGDVLKELEQEGQLESQLLTPPAPAMQRRYYRLKQGASAHV